MVSRAGHGARKPASLVSSSTLALANQSPGPAGCGRIQEWKRRNVIGFAFSRIMRCPLHLMGKFASILVWISRTFRQSAFSFSVSSRSSREAFAEKLEKFFLGAKPPLFPSIDLFYQAFEPTLVRFGRSSKSYNESASHHLHRVRLR